MLVLIFFHTSVHAPASSGGSHPPHGQCGMRIVRLNPENNRVVRNVPLPATDALTSDVVVSAIQYTHTHTHTRLTAFSSGTTQVSRYQKGKTNLDFTEARDSEWQWHQLGHKQTVCTSLQTDNHASTPPLKFLQARCPSCRPTNSVKALIQCEMLFNVRSKADMSQFNLPHGNDN